MEEMIHCLNAGNVTDTLKLAILQPTTSSNCVSVISTILQGCMRPAA